MGARATSKATTKAHEYATEKSTKDEIRLTKNTLLLLNVELTTAWEIYIEEYGNELLELRASEPYICTYPVGANTFPIYDSAPSHLANIDPELSAKIVRTYMRMKGLISMIELNNTDCETAFTAGNDAVNNRLEEAKERGIEEITESATQRLNEYRENYIRLEATKLGMGVVADGMKSLTIELQELVTIIKLEVEQATK